MTSKTEKELIYLPGGNGAEPVEGQELLPALDDMTPREIVAELDKYIVGQGAAKRAVAVALRNRVRRQKLAPELAEEIAPKNILMIGPTGVGKTEIARRLARLAQSPFLKIEASKFTEVGYVGRDVESMVRDLVELGVDMIRAERLEEVRAKAAQNAEDRLLDILLPPARPAILSISSMKMMPACSTRSTAVRATLSMSTSFCSSSWVRYSSASGTFILRRLVFP